MKALILILLLPFAAQAEKKAFGDKITMKDPVAIDQAVKTISEKEVLVSGKVKKVCKKKGCWMAIGENGTNVRVTFKDYGFFVPTSLIGKKILAQGQLKVREMSVKEARHFAEDAGKSKEEIAKITKPVNEYRFVASGVKVFN